jgi:hypothetical protein
LHPQTAALHSPTWQTESNLHTSELVAATTIAEQRTEASDAEEETAIIEATVIEMPRL